METSPPAVRQARMNRWLWFSLVLFAYTLIAANFATQSYIHSFHGANALPWWKYFTLRQAPTFYSWALVTPVIVLVARQFPFERGRRWKALLAHALGVLLVAPVQVACDFGLAVAVTAAFNRGGLDRLLDGTSRDLAAGFVDVPQMYAVIAALFYTADYYRKFREREVRASRLEAQLSRAQLVALRMQLNPHFLFNTLNAIAVLIHRDPDKAERMVTLLSDLLRTSLKGGDIQEVPLREELDLLSRYLEIERTRFPDRLSVRIDASPETLDAAVPNLILQPLAENAVRHGIAPKLTAGSIRVAAQRDNGALRLIVSDDGVGGSGTGRIHEGLGLANTRERLRHLYGEASRLEVLEPSEGGLAVRMTIPFRLLAPPSGTAS